MVEISVCVPIYGVEKFIEKCVISLFEQSKKDGIEFIFINDCTKDRSVEILKQTLEKYPDRKSQTKIIHHDENLGLGAARRTALKNACGEYIIFCDSDDWVEIDMYESMLSCARKTDADLVICGFSQEFNKKSLQIRIPNYQSSDEILIDMMNGNSMCVVWNKLVKREILRVNGINFPIGIDMWEDVNVTLPICSKIKKLGVVNKPLYHYNQLNINSYTHILNEKSLKSMLSVISNLELFFSINNPLLIKHLSLLKLTAKLNCLLNSFGREQLKYTSLYPEANSEIIKYKKLSVYWRLGLLAVRYKQLWIFNLLRYIKTKIF